MLIKEEDKVKMTLKHVFEYADNGQWNKLQELLTNTLYINIDSVSEDQRIKGNFSSEQFCNIWKEFTEALDGTHREMGELIVKPVEDGKIQAFFTSTITHFKKNNTSGNTRIYRGIYKFDFVENNSKWCICLLRYYLTNYQGNHELT